MYIGPWQEYKLAQVLKLKNDLYEGKSAKLSTEALQKHDTINKPLKNSHISTPSTRSFSSEPIQKPYPTFDLDVYYKQWKKVESIMAMSEAPARKPPLPVQSGVRKRQGKSIQEKRVNKMRQLYGIGIPEQQPGTPKKSDVIRAQLPPLPPSPNDKNKKSFTDKIKNDIKTSETISLSEKLNKKNVYEEDKKDSKINKNENRKEKLIEGLWSLKIENTDEVKGKDKFSNMNNHHELDVIEESFNQEGVDGLLQWVENLPEEISGSQMMSSKGFIL
ncbi:hypothetical protein SteCoe_12643 [Stentor coeruleus]|uniref:Uncharacterized protein n=1 Tax=Stentor coeruleus TaxID=5963 RepID=A0A1R2CAE7_9CILI|nr:hypothetical protein SteCoe_12643 [Stentor coeruleus]